MRKIIYELAHISIISSIRMNFSVLPFMQAIRFPILVAKHIKIDGSLSKNTIVLKGAIKTGRILLGFGGSDNLLYTRTRKSYLKLRGSGKIIFEGTARISPQFTLIVNDSDLKLGSGFSCNHGCMLISNCGMSFGKDCMIGSDVSIRDYDGHTVMEKQGERYVEKVNKKPVKIGEHVWICSHVSILKGVEIGNDCVIAHSSVCTKPFAGNGLLIGGYPAKIINDGISWKK